MITISQLHAFCIHFPLVLFPLGLIFDLAGLYKASNSYIRIGWYFLAGTAGATFAAIVTGLLSKSALTPEQLRHPYMEFHEGLTFLFTALLVTLFFLRLGKKGRIPFRNRKIYLLVCAVALLVLFIAGHFGGLMVYQLGFGIR